MSPQARLGAFVLIALILLGFATTRIGDFVWFKQDRNIVEAKFDDLLGLEVQAPVRMAGVRVGYIQEILLRNNRAVARIALEPGVKLPASTRASIVGRGMVGEKYLSLRADPGDTDWLPDGATIPTVPSGDINTFISKISGVVSDVHTLTQTLNEFLGDQEGESLRALIERTNRTVTELGTILSENRSDLRRTVADMRRATHDVASLLRKHRENLDRVAKQLPEAVESGRRFFEKGEKAMADADAVLLDNRENLYRMIFELRKAAENLELLSDDLRRNPWKIMNKEPEIPRGPRAKREKMEEMLLTTGQMGVAPAQE